MVPRRATEKTCKHCSEDASGRHHHRRGNSYLKMTFALQLCAAKAAVRRRRHSGVSGPGARLLHDDWRRRGVQRSMPSSNARPGRGDIRALRARKLAAPRCTSETVHPLRSSARISSRWCTTHRIRHDAAYAEASTFQERDCKDLPEISLRSQPADIASLRAAAWQFWLLDLTRWRWSRIRLFRVQRLRAGFRRAAGHPSGARRAVPRSADRRALHALPFRRIIPSRECFPHAPEVRRPHRTQTAPNVSNRCVLQAAHHLKRQWL